jgi:hypothetical protein
MITLEWTASWRPWEDGDIDKAQIFGIVTIRVNGASVMSLPMRPWATARQGKPSSAEISSACAQFLRETLIDAAKLSTEAWY